jgi:hypothetical protein
MVKTYNSRAIKASTESGKPVISWVYYLFRVKTTSFVKVA